MQESYKSFIKQKIWIFIMILLVIRMVSVCITGYDSHYMIDENEKYYNEYLEKNTRERSQMTKTKTDRRKNNKKE